MDNKRTIKWREHGQKKTENGQTMDRTWSENGRKMDRTWSDNGRETVRKWTKNGQKGHSCVDFAGTWATVQTLINHFSNQSH